MAKDGQLCDPSWGQKMRWGIKSFSSNENVIQKAVTQLIGFSCPKVVYAVRIVLIKMDHHIHLHTKEFPFVWTVHSIKF